MIRLAYSLLPASLVLTGCIGPGLAGDWEGEVECDEGEIEVALELESDGGGDYSGEMDWTASLTFVEGGDTYQLEIDMKFDVEIESDGRGEQDLDNEAELKRVACRLTSGGQLLSNDCDEMGLEYDIGSTSDLGDLTWDGKDTIEVEDGDCAGELERS